MESSVKIVYTRVMMHVYRGFWGRGIEIRQNKISKINIFGKGGSWRGAKIHFFDFALCIPQNRLELVVLGVLAIVEPACRGKVQQKLAVA